MNGVGILGRTIPALLADKYFGILNALIPAAGISGVVLFGWIGVASTGGACSHGSSSTVSPRMPLRVCFQRQWVVECYGGVIHMPESVKQWGGGGRLETFSSTIAEILIISSLSLELLKASNAWSALKASVSLRHRRDTEITFDSEHRTFVLQQHSAFSFVFRHL